MKVFLLFYSSFLLNFLLICEVRSQLTNSVKATKSPTPSPNKKPPSSTVKPAPAKCNNTEIPLIANGRINGLQTSNKSENISLAKFSPVGKRLQLMCNKAGGHVVRGSGIIECTKYRKWRVDGYCEKANECDAKSRQTSANNIEKRQYYDDYMATDFQWPYYQPQSPEAMVPSCDDEPYVENGFQPGLGYQASVGETRQFGCNPGFELVAGMSTSMCLASGTWQFLGNCQRKIIRFPLQNAMEIAAPGCRSSPYVSNGLIAGIYILKDGGSFGTMVCDKGYTLHGSYEVFCLPTGEWIFGDSHCQRCGSENGTITTTPNPFCHDAPSIKNGYIEIKTYGRGVIRCYTGFIIVGSEDALCIPQNGYWQVFGSCVRTPDLLTTSPGPRPGPVCSEFHDVEHGYFAVAVYPGPETTYGYLICDNGYQLEGSDSAECDHRTGLWTVNGICANIKNVSIVDIEIDNAVPCKTWLAVVNGYVEPTITFESDKKTMGILRCHPSFQLYGNNITECYHAEGKWRLNGTCWPIDGPQTMTTGRPSTTTTMEPKCKQIPYVQNGQISRESKGVVGSIEILKCNPGYERQGSEWVICQSDLNWQVDGWCLLTSTTEGPEKPTPTPTPTPRCPIPPPVENGFITRESDRTVGSCETLVCDDYFVLDGHYEVICNWSLTWQIDGRCVALDNNQTTTTPSSTTAPPPKCGQVPSVPNGKISEQSPCTVWSIEILECNTGFVLLGDRIVICRPELFWDVKGRCVIVSTSTSTKATTVTRNSTSSKVTTISTPPYSSTTSTSRTTTPDNKCKDRPIVKNGWVTWVTNGSIGSVERLICYTPPYDLEGDSRVICQSNLIWQVNGRCVDWSSTTTTSKTTLSTTSSYPPPKKWCPSEQKIDFGYITGWIMEDGTMNGSVHCLEFTQPLPCVVCDVHDGKWIINGKCNVPGSGSTTTPVILAKCDAVPLIQNGRITQSAPSPIVGAIEYIECNPGYVVKGDSRVECSDYGMWIVNGTCEQNKTSSVCAVYPKLLNGGVSYIEPVDTAYLRCDPDYVLQGDQFAKCVAENQWRFNATCVHISKMPCYANANTSVPSGFITNVQSIIENQVYSGEVICISGYVLRGLNIVICSSSNLLSNRWSWNLNDSYCESVDRNCTSRPSVENGVVVDTHGWVRAGIFYCNPGCKLTGGNNYECAPDGRWLYHGSCQSPNATQECPNQKPHVLNGQISSTKNVSKIGAIERITCDPGYVISGSETVQCSINFLWIINGSCQPFNRLASGAAVNSNATTSSLPILNQRCPYVPQFENADTIVDEDGYYKFVCRPGFKVYGWLSMSCDWHVAGEWSPNGYCEPDPNYSTVPPIKNPVCTSPPSIANGNIVGADIENMIGTIVLIVCNQGYTIQGSNEVICAENAAWVIDGYCIKASFYRFAEFNCGDLPKVPNGIVKSVASTPTSTLAILKCNDQYQLKGSANFECTNGNWQVNGACLANKARLSSALTKCENVQLPIVQNGQIITSSNSANVSYLLACNPGYTPHPSNIVDCSEQGQWTLRGDCQGQKVMCPNDLPQIQNGQIKSTSSMRTGPIQVVVCNSGFILAGRNIVRCNSTGKWQIAGKCLSKASVKGNGSNCTDRFSVNNGVIADGVLTCNAGYQVRGSQFVNCDHILGVWVIGGTCEKANKTSACGQLPRIQNGTIVQKKSSPPIAMIACNSSYVFNGSSTTVECSASNGWEISGKCVPVTPDCPAVPLVENGAIKPQKGPASVGTTRRLTCDQGYVVRGSDVVECTKRSKWLIKGYCSLPYCSELPKIDNGKVLEHCPRAAVGAQRTIVCDAGFVISGSALAICEEPGRWVIKGTCLSIQARQIELSQAAANGNVEKVDAILTESGKALDVNWRDNETHQECKGNVTSNKMSVIRGSALHRAVHCNRSAEIVRMLLDAGANVNANQGYRNYTPLHYASKIGNKNVVKLLLDRGADVNAKDENALTPLILAAVNGQAATCRLLLDRGANRDGCNLGKPYCE